MSKFSHAPEGYCSSRPVNLIIGEMHADFAAKEVVLEMIPTLSERGYTFCLEHGENRSFTETRKDMVEILNATRSRQTEVELGHLSLISRLERTLDPNSLRKVMHLSASIFSQSIRNSFEGIELENNSDQAPLKKILKDNSPTTGNIAENAKEVEESINLLEEYFRCKILRAGLELSAEFAIKILDKIEECKIPYKNIDLARTSQNAHSEPDMLLRREKRMAELIENTEGPVIALVGLGHIKGIMERISTDKRLQPFIVVGAPPLEYSDANHFTLTPWKISVIDSRNFENGSLGVAQLILSSRATQAESLKQEAVLER